MTAPPETPGIEASLYVHIPFCSSKCAYCTFFSQPVSHDDRRIDAFLDEILKNLVRLLETYHVLSIPSVYIGGGTPSFLGAARLKRLFSVLLRENTARLLQKDAEITIEVNPESMDEAVLDACAAGGITRISAGVQTLHDESRAAIGRAGSARTVKKRLGLLAARFPGRFSCDLISGLPFQTEAVLLRDIESVLSYAPAHISLYDLEPHGAVQSPYSVDEAADLWIAGRDALSAAGFTQYEVSNFSRGAENRSRHNLRYWNMQNWLGLGPTASGTVIDDEAGTGIRETDGKLEYIPRELLLKETLLMGFRTIDGPPAALFKRRFGIELPEAVPKTLDTWREYLKPDHAKPALTSRGLLFLNRFLSDCFSELDKR